MYCIKCIEKYAIIKNKALLWKKDPSLEEHRPEQESEEDEDEDEGDGDDEEGGLVVQHVVGGVGADAEAAEDLEGEFHE